MSQTKQSWVVHKFGGTSVGNADRYQAVSKIIASFGPHARKGIVVSAMKGVTDALLELVELAKNREETYLARLDTLKKRHTDTLQQLIRLEDIRTSLATRLEQDFRDIGEILRGIWLSRTASDRNEELISGFGEVWSAQFLDALFREQGLPSRWLDAREVLIVEPLEKSVVVDWAASTEKLNQWLEKNPTDLLVITGFVASTAQGVATTLRRNGSDFSASIFGALLEATEITIWTDVDGVLSADPRLVPEAVVLDELSYNEMAELAYFGAKVVHPATVAPAIGRNIPIWIRNTFNPSFRGTKIHSRDREDGSSNEKALHPAKGFSVIDPMALINVEGTGMVGVPGIAERLFGALRSAGVSVVMISQASSEQSICFAIPEAQAALAKKAVESQFYAELQQGLIHNIEITLNSAILAVVGDNMADSPGVAGRFLTALGKAGINIQAIAQGSSERNISVVIRGSDSTRALRAVHAAFYLSNHTLSVGIIGSGLIGNALYRQLCKQIPFMKAQRGIDLRIRGVMNSRKMLLGESIVDIETLDSQGQDTDLARFERHVRSEHIPHSVIIDATASSDIPKHYPDWLKSGNHVITPNKKAATAEMKSYRELKEAVRAHSRHFLYSTNVGAGLPIIQTLRDLHRTGDRILRIEGVFSGTLSFIFNSFKGDKPFSEIVSQARSLGYTEPDPRDDLSGTDVARKLVILAREIGLELELQDVRVESLVPAELRSGDAQRYLRDLPSNDRTMGELLENARKNGQILRYVGTIEPDAPQGTPIARVRLETYPDTHAFSRISGSDNIVVFKTARYEKQPLIIQGPGAGPEVTAAGVFADLLKLSAYLGAPT